MASCSEGARGLLGLARLCCMILEQAVQVVAQWQGEAIRACWMCLFSQIFSQQCGYSSLTGSSVLSCLAHEGLAHAAWESVLAAVCIPFAVMAWHARGELFVYVCCDMPENGQEHPRPALTSGACGVPFAHCVALCLYTSTLVPT